MLHFLALATVLASEAQLSWYWGAQVLREWTSGHGIRKLADLLGGSSGHPGHPHHQWSLGRHQAYWFIGLQCSSGLALHPLFFSSFCFNHQESFHNCTGYFQTRTSHPFGECFNGDHPGSLRGCAEIWCLLSYPSMDTLDRTCSVKTGLRHRPICLLSVRGVLQGVWVRIQVHNSLSTCSVTAIIRSKLSVIFLLHIVQAMYKMKEAVEHEMTPLWKKRDKEL